LSIAASQDYTLAAFCIPSSGTTTGTTPTHDFIGAQTNYLSIASNGFRAKIDNNTTALNAYTKMDPALFMATRRGSTISTYVPSGAVVTAATGTRAQTFTTICAGRYSGNNHTDTETYLLLVWNRGIGLDEYLALSKNTWQLFPPSPRQIWIPSAALLDLAGNAIASASASGALSVAVPVSGAAIGVLTASGALSTAMPLSGVAAAVASASGNLVLGIALSGAAVASASATGQMVLQVSLDGAAIAHASATGALSVVGGYDLAGAAVATVSATGALTTSIPLAGAAVCFASASGDLSSSAAVPLSGSAVAAFAGQGSLTVTVSLSGAAVAQAQAAGGLAVQIPLSGSAVAHLSAMGYLSGGQSGLASDPRFTVQHAALDYNVFAKSRNFTVTYAH
jgi:hypothetical protein